MKFKTIFILAIAAAAAGCSANKKLIRNNVVSPGNDRVVPEEVILYPAGDPKTITREREWATQVAAAEAPKHTGRHKDRQPQKQRPVMTFTPAQSQHVKLPGINPLPQGGILELDLTAMADEFCYPCEGKPISPYGTRGNSVHTGLDIKAQLGDTIRAAFPGVVRMAKEYSGYGNIVVIRHYEGFETVYSHGSKILVKVNDVVEAGDPVALAGRTGRATTEHLHFEVRAGDGHIDPSKVIDPETRSLRTGKLYMRYLDGNLIAYCSDAELQDHINRRPKASAAAKPDVKVRTGESSQAYASAVYYNVKKGDTLSAIAVRNNTTVTKICQLNNIKSTALLQINQRLRVK